MNDEHSGGVDRGDSNSGDASRDEDVGANDPGENWIDLRSLFGADFTDPFIDPAAGRSTGTVADDSVVIPDVSATDQQLLRAALAAAVSSPPPSALSTDAVLAAARRARRAAGDTHDPAGASGSPGALRNERPHTPAGFDGPGRAPDFGARPMVDRPTVDPVDVDELAARRRRRIRGGLLAAAAVAAVVAIGVPIAKLGNGSSNTAQSGAAYSASDAGGAPAGTSAGAADAAGSAESGPERAAGSDTAQAAAPAASSAAESAAAGSSASSAAASAGDGTSGRSPSAADSGTSTKSERQPSGSGGSASKPLSSTAGGAAATASSRGDASSSAEYSAGGASCAWPELPATLDAAATSSFGAGVVGAPSVLTSDCRPTRLGGAVLPAADGSRGGVTVQVLQNARAGDCADDVGSCRRMSADTYATSAGGSKVVWLYRNGLQVRVGATTDLNLTDRELIAFAARTADLLR